MIKTLLAQVKEYKTPSLLAPLCAALEVFFDMSIPFVIAQLIDQGIQADNHLVGILDVCDIRCHPRHQTSRAVFIDIRKGKGLNIIVHPLT